MSPIAFRSRYLLALLIAAPLLLGCPRSKTEDSSAPAAAKREPPLRTPRTGEPLRVAVSAMLGPTATYDAYAGLFDGLAASLGRPSRFVQRRTYAEINALLLAGELDLAFICSGAYVDLHDSPDVEIVALPVVNGEKVYRSLIIVPADSPVTSFEELAGKRFAFTDLLSNTGHLYPVFRLTRTGKDPTRFFSSVSFSGSHDRSVLAVHRRLVDGAAVDSLVFNSLAGPGGKYTGGVRVIERSPDFAIPPVVTHSSVPSSLRAKMRRYLLELHKTPEGSQLLANVGFDGFAAGEKAAYASILDMRKAVQSGGW